MKIKKVRVEDQQRSRIPLSRAMVPEAANQVPQATADDKPPPKLKIVSAYHECFALIPLIYDNLLVSGDSDLIVILFVGRLTGQTVSQV